MTQETQPDTLTRGSATAAEMMLETELNTLTLLDGIDYAYFEADLSGVLTRANESFCKGVGRARDEIIGRTYRRFTDPKHVRRIYQLFNAVYQTGQPQKGIEYNFRRPDGTSNVAEGAIALVRDKAGQPIGFRGVLHDVTRRKQVEEALQQAKEVAERELEIGRRIQAGFLPEQLPQPAGWEIASRFRAANEVAGDFYDAFALSGGKRIGLVVADVCGKGVGAALFMALFRSLIRAFADQHASLSWMDALSRDVSATSEGGSVGRRRAMLSTGTTPLKNAIVLTNNYIARTHGQAHMFATIFFGVLDPATGALIYINGGHEPPLLIGPTGIKASLAPTGPAVGLFPDLEFRIEQVELEPGDILLAFTDGVIDARDPARERYAERRLLSLAQAPAASAAALLDRIQADLDDHIAGADQFDDITMLAVRRLPASNLQPPTSNLQSQEPGGTLRAGQVG